MAHSRPAAADDDIVKVYLSEIGSYSLLTKDDEVRLAKAIEVGCEAAASLARCGSRDAIATISQASPFCIAGITFLTAIPATPRTPQRILPVG